MKIIQSFWSKPSVKKLKLNDSDRNNGGWLEKNYNYYSWALSCLQFRKFYQNVELITDAYGYDMLINKLGLPYTNVIVALDTLNNYHTDLWAIGKLYSYKMQSQPFIHADSDIYIWNKFDIRMEAAQLLVQNLEVNYFYNIKSFENISRMLAFLPPVFHSMLEQKENINSVNAGILGGNDVDFFQEFSEMAFDFVDRNTDILSHIDVGIFNTIFEQFLFYALSQKKDIKITTLFDHINHTFDGLAELASAPGQTDYVHPVGYYKRTRHIGDLLEHQLLTYYPEYFFKINDLLRQNQI